jgi:hypothetical protein
MSIQKLKNIKNKILNVIKEDRKNLYKDPKEYRVGDVARYSYKTFKGDTHSSVTRIDKPGNLLVDLLNDISLGKLDSSAVE